MEPMLAVRPPGRGSAGLSCAGTPSPSPAHPSIVSLLLVLPRGKGQAMRFQTLLHSCPSQLHTTRTKREKADGSSQGCVRRQLGRCCVRRWVLSPSSPSPHARPLQYHFPTLAWFGHGQGRRAESARPSASCGDDGWAWGSQKAQEEMQELCSWRSMGWALPPQCWFHLSLQKSCVRVGSSGRVLVWGQQ